MVYVLSIFLCDFFYLPDDICGVSYIQACATYSYSDPFLAGIMAPYGTQALVRKLHAYIEGIFQG